MDYEAEIESLNWVEELTQAKDDLQVMLAYEKSKRWANRRWLVHPFNQGRQRQEDFLHTISQELKQFPEMFKKLTRMDPDLFELLLHLVERNIKSMHETETAIVAEQRLALTVMYLARVTSVVLLSLTNRIAESTIYKIINVACTGIYEALSRAYLKFPDVQTWRNIGKQFGELWQIPGYFTGIDGKHIHITAPDNSCSLYYNYKGTFSIVLMDAVNHNLEFTWVDVGQFGGQSDGGIFSRSSFGIDLENKSLNIPRELIRLPNSNTTVPYYFAGDEAFRLRMKPDPGQNLDETQLIFNYRLSRAKRCVESVFGILVMRWRILENRIGLNPDSEEMIVNACVCLHNFLSTMNDTSPDIERCRLDQAQQGTSTFEPDYEMQENDDGSRIQEKLKPYFVSPQGQVLWQLERVRRGLNL